MYLVTFWWIEKEKIGFAFIYVYHHRMQCFCLVASYIDIISYAPETKKFFIHQFFFLRILRSIMYINAEFIYHDGYK